MAATGKRYKAEQIVNHLREIDVMTANGKTVPEACKRIGISEQLRENQKRVGRFIPTRVGNTKRKGLR